MVAQVSTQSYVSKHEASRALGVSLYVLNRLIERGAVATRQLPGDRLKVSAESIVRILEQSQFQPEKSQ